MIHGKRRSAPSRSHALRAPIYDRFQPVSPRAQDIPQLLKGRALYPLPVLTHFPDEYEPIQIALTLFGAGLRRQADRMMAAFATAEKYLLAILRAEALLTYEARHYRVHPSSPT